MQASATPARRAMRFQKSLVPATVALGLAMFTMGSTASPVSAAEIGKGRALVRIDAAQATVSKNADGSYTLRLPANSSGQFFGERPNASGKMRLRVGNVSAKQLMKKWNHFRYTSSGVKATIAWNAKKPSTLEGAIVRIFKPSATSEAVTFRFTTDEFVPKSLEDVTVNLRRAPKSSTRTDYNPQATVNLSGNMNFFAGFYNYGNVDVHLMNGSSHCWSYAFASEKTEDIPSESCAGIPQWGGSVTWKENPPECTGCMPNGTTGVYLYTNLQPSGEAAFVYNQKVLNIDEW